MGVLNLFLPPFAPDYSGACALAFPLDALIVIHDASGCTSNYTGFDEPRWYGSHKYVYCSGLRKMDVALGDDEKFIRRIETAAAEINPELIVLVGSPVPMVAGTDLDGMAHEIESRTGICSLACKSNGLGDYLDGISFFGQTLLDRVLASGDSLREARTINLLGATPLDFSEETLTALKTDLRERGWTLQTVLSENVSVKDLQTIPQAQLNLALNAGAADLGEWLLRFYNMPYVVGLPVGTKGGQFFYDLLDHAAETAPQAHHHLYKPHDKSRKGGDKKILILTEAVLAHALALAWAHAYPAWSVEIGTPFSKTTEVLKAHTPIVGTEAALLDLLAKPHWTAVLADPLILDLLPDDAEAERIPLAHFAISSHVGAGKAWNYVGSRFELNRTRNINRIS